ncbi:MAG TPA: asparagine synthase-related protein [Candidatus Paceibacterota bacterium]
MSFFLKSGNAMYWKSDMEHIELDNVRLFSRALDVREASGMLAAYCGGTLASYLNALDTPVFLAVIIDESDDSVLIVNDKFGSNQLFYAVRDGVLYASDDVTSLFAAWQDAPRIKAASAYELLELYTVCPPRTLFEGVSAVPMASILHCRGIETRLEPYWNVREVLASKTRDYESLVGEFRDSFIKSLKRGYKKGETGVALSGGLDSGGALAVLTHIAAEPIPSLSYGPHGKTSGDLVGARASAKESGSPQTFLYPSLVDLARLPDMMRGLSQPFTVDVLFPNAMLFEQARTMGIKRLVFGYGSEMLLGNLAMAKYADSVRRVERLLPRFLSRALFSVYARYKKLSQNQLEFLMADSWGRRFLQVRAPLFTRNKRVYARLPRDFSDLFIYELDALVQDLPLNDAIVRMYLTTWENYLQWHDVGSLARRYGIECVMPFDTPAVAETLFHAPLEFRRLMGWDKKMIRDMFKPFITERLYHAKGKSLVVPYTEFLAPVRNDLLEYLATSTLITDLVDINLYRQSYGSLPEPGLHLARLFGLAVWYDVNWNTENLPNLKRIIAVLQSSK